MPNKCISIIRQKGNFIDKTNKSVEFDNLVFYLDSGSIFYPHESLIVGSGKPMQVKVKTIDFPKLYDQDPKLLLGKELHFYSENGRIVKLEIK